MFIFKALKLLLLPATLGLGYALYRRQKREAFCANCGTIQDKSLLFTRCPSCTTPASRDLSPASSARGTGTPEVVLHPAYEKRVVDNITALQNAHPQTAEVRRTLEDLIALQEDLNNATS